jgi:TPR repeat protein
MLRRNTSLRRMYNKGEGVTRDYGQAVAWCRKAAEQGHEEARIQSC